MITLNIAVSIVPLSGSQDSVQDFIEGGPKSPNSDVTWGDALSFRIPPIVKELK
jgi:hypothetical protein